MVRLTLADEAFYHLDTCLSVLSSDHLAYVPCAFDAESRKMLERLDVELIEVPENEARTTLAANMHSLDGKQVLIDRANRATIARLEDHGYDPVPLDTSEFHKAGGSVFCMTNQVW